MNECGRGGHLPDSVPIHLHYEAAPSCPDREQMVAMIEAHAQGRDDPRELAIAISAEGEGLRGTFTVGGATREVRGATCAEVASALVVVAALAIEEQAPLPVIELRHDASWLAVGSGVAVFTGMAPSARFGVPIFVDLDRGMRLRIAFDVTTRDNGSTSSFRWTGGRIDGCPHVWSTGPLELAPCLGLEGGVIEAHGVGVAMVATNYRPWLTPQAIVRFGVKLGRATLAAEGSVGAPLVRDSFVISPNVAVYDVPAIAANAGVTLAIAIL